MTYAARQDLIDRYGEDELIQLTDRAGSGVIDDAVLDRAIADADALVDANLAGRYTPPFGSVPRVLVGAACDIARYYLYDKGANDVVTQRYKDAVKLLQAIAAGTISIGLDSTGGQPAPSDGAHMESAGRVFSRDDNAFI